ncbi:hypothetical protein CPAR01_04692 [Colletotrichum paranaense]|uniref:Uncharacterized protein n=1 Tax=Colletotrichum paranaense TaxID=1914294 RepID=A0ABQ9SXR5_9PEZI|nr:uncharacterized protein CPAR01_04692 [Colletotrichum paranaense]KAK1544059.1 hypothetical protein CPAR01_04692 [Colletotrichum paranaense]
MNLSPFPENDYEQQRSHLELAKSKLKHFPSTVFPYFLSILSEDSFLEPKPNYRNGRNDSTETFGLSPSEIFLSPIQPPNISTESMTDPITVAAIGAAATVAVCLITTAAPEIKQALRCRRTGRLFRKLNKALQCPESKIQLVHLIVSGTSCGD